MKNRIVRWVIYLIVGFAIGAGINHYNKQNKIDEGVVELSPDAVQEEMAIPSRFEDAEESPAGEAVDEMNDMDEALKEAGEATIDDADEAVQEKADEVMDNLKKMMPAREMPEDTAIVEEGMPTDEMIDEGMANKDIVVDESVKESIEEAVESGAVIAPGAMEEPAEEIVEEVPAVTPMPQ